MTKKEQFLRKFNEAFATGDTKFLIAHVTKDIIWTIYGDQYIDGIEAFSAAVEAMKTDTEVQLTIDKVITHGSSAAVNGIMEMMKNETMVRYAFSDVYTLSGFKNPKVKQMKSYVLKIKADEK